MDTEANAPATGAPPGVPACGAAMLSALAGGEALPAGELAYRAFVSPSVARAKLAAMVADGLLSVERCGRHRYYRMATAGASRQAGRLIAAAAPPRLRTRPDRARVAPLRAARTCYGHLAGRLGIVLTETLTERRLVRLDDHDYSVTEEGDRWLADFGIDVEALRKRRRVFARRCIDWSERRPHIGGALGAALAARMLELDWIRRAEGTRAVFTTAEGRRQLRTRLGIKP